MEDGGDGGYGRRERSSGEGGEGRRERLGKGRLVVDIGVVTRWTLPCLALRHDQYVFCRSCLDSLHTTVNTAAKLTYSNDTPWPPATIDAQRSPPTICRQVLSVTEDESDDRYPIGRLHQHRHFVAYTSFTSLCGGLTRT